MLVIKKIIIDFSTTVGSCMETLEKKLSQHERLIAQLLKETKLDS